MKKINKTPVAVAVGAAVATTFTATAANAEANPFGMSELSGGYMQMAESDKAGEMSCGAGMGMKEGSCGEGKCGDMMGETKVKEGQCAGNKKAKPATKTAPKAEEGKCGEGKCGEGKCGAMMEGDKMKKGMEGQCGEMMKGKEGACGEMIDQNKAGGDGGGWPIKKN